MLHQEEQIQQGRHCLRLIISDLLIPVEKDGVSEYIKAAAQKLFIGEEQLKLFKILSKTLVSKDPRQFCYKLSIVVTVAPAFENKNNLPEYFEKILPKTEPKVSGERPLVIGFGPAGMFAALELLEQIGRAHV
jgi:uncharacterized FAD-dependent dehydrogenase